MKLHIGTTTTGKEFYLPIDLVTQSVAILAKRGVGKTYTAAVFAEQLMTANQVPIIIDPTGAHWGLKSSADGKKPGFPVYVFGGDHADLPLEEHSGEIIARTLVENPFPAVIDLSLFRKGQATRFLCAFFETLYRLNRTPLHLICDEADAYAPQKPWADEARTLGAMEDIVRRGRIRGIGCTLITQRPAVLNKNVLTQCEMLVAMRLVHPKDIDAIKEWVGVHGDPVTAYTMIQDLPSLPIGTAWIWSPGWGDIFERVKIRARSTFDSSATPKPGQQVVKPKEFAKVDIEKLGKEIVATVERAKADDPKALRARITKLEHELTLLPEYKEVRVEVPVVTDAQIFAIKGLEQQSRQLASQAEVLWNKAMEIEKSVTQKQRELATQRPASKTVHPMAPKLRPVRTATEDVQTGDDVPLSKCARALLTVLVQFGDSTSRSKVALVSGYSVNSSTFSNGLSELRVAGYISGSDPITPTDAGCVALGEYDPLPTGDAALNHWQSRVSKCAAALLKATRNHMPQISRVDLAEESGYSVTSSTFSNGLSELRVLGVIGSDSTNVWINPEFHT